MEMLAIGFTFIAIVVLGIFVARKRATAELSDEQFTQLASRVREELGSAQSEALSQNSQTFLDLAETRLQAATARSEEQLKARGAEIDKSVENVSTELKRLRDYVETTDRERGLSLERLRTVTEESRKTMEALGATTGQLTQTLTASQTRGQWGERMAQDILQVAGFVEGVQYLKNSRIDEGTGRPDFTFLLPHSRTLHMDVKFPLAAYLRYLQAESDSERTTAVRDFLRDTRSRVQEVATRDYIDPANGTLDYALLFIPNEQVYGFIHEHDPNLLDSAIRDKVVMCSPFTLFAVLAVVRQASENFLLSQQTGEILKTLGAFNQQWVRYKGQTERVQHGFETTRKAFEDLVGTRTRMLDRQVERVESMRLEAGLEVLALPIGGDVADSSDSDEDPDD